MHAQGRFFPGAIAYMTYTFTTLTSRVAYKTYLFVLLAILVLLIGWWVSRVTGSVAAALVSSAALASCWQFRYPIADDGLTSFVGLVPWTMVLMMATMLVLARRPSRRSVIAIVAGTLIWTLAVITYEYTVILTPAILVGFWFFETDRRWRVMSVIAIVVPSLFELVFSESLGTHFGAQQGSEYSLNLKVGLVMSTTAKQLAGALPLSEYWIPGHYKPQLHVAIYIYLAAIVIAVAVVYFLVREWQRLPTISARRLARLAVVGGWIWLAPALLVGSTGRWQIDVVWGQSYIPVVFETLGFALVMTAAIGGLKRWTRRSQRLSIASNATAITLLGIFGVSVALTAALNYSMVL